MPKKPNVNAQRSQVDAGLPILFLMGPSASGKTDLALDLFKEFPVEIISVDSAMVYQHMDIGTAKPSDEILQSIPHHLINIREADSPYSVEHFTQDSLQLIKNIEKKGKIPLLVGGSMMYFHALANGLLNLPGKNEALRVQLEQQSQLKGTDYLHQQLQQCDSQRANDIHPNDKVRLIRALEIFDGTGKTWEELQSRATKPALAKRIKPLALTRERSKLHERVALRFKLMLEQGLIEEVRWFFNQPERFANTPAMRSVGYAQIWAYLSGEYDKDTMTDKAIVSTRGLVKRQFTWLNHWPGLQWFDMDETRKGQTLKESIKKLLY